MPDKETGLPGLPPEVLPILLRDHTTGRNIFWATHDYEALGSQYDYHAEILPQLITGEHSMVVRPRVLKTKENQTDRSKDMAEVFTPSWICNAQNNLVCDALPKEMSWQDFVRTTCLEITCGEAPYLVSRYDTTTGDLIPLHQRIGLLDRKLSLVSKNTETSDEWHQWARIAYQHTYGYEWQGDNLLLARLNLLLSYLDYYEARFGQTPPPHCINDIADIISWNLWQMDGLRGTPPDYPSPGELLDNPVPDMFTTYCILRDWDKDEEIRYLDIMNR